MKKETKGEEIFRKCRKRMAKYTRQQREDLQKIVVLAFEKVEKKEGTVSLEDIWNAIILPSKK